MTGPEGEARSVWKAPPPEALPGPAATLEEIIRFVRLADPTEHFRAQWGDEYQDNARAVWARCAEAYRTGAAQPVDPDELMLCLAHDLVIAPYLAVPESAQLPFLRWLIDGMRGR